MLYKTKIPVDQTGILAFLVLQEGQFSPVFQAFLSVFLLDLRLIPTIYCRLCLVSMGLDCDIGQYKTPGCAHDSNRESISNK